MINLSYDSKLINLYNWLNILHQIRRQETVLWILKEEVNKIKYSSEKETHEMRECKQILGREDNLYRSIYRTGAKFSSDWHCSFIIREKKIRVIYLIMHAKLVESDLFEEKRFYKR